MVFFVKVAAPGPAHKRNLIEVPVEAGGFMSMRTLRPHFPGAWSLKYRTEAGIWRALSVSEDGQHLYPAIGDAWSEKAAYVVVNYRLP